MRSKKNVHINIKQGAEIKVKKFLKTEGKDLEKVADLENLTDKFIVKTIPE